ncbi:hypothetical protein ANN_27097 [Periplaneta americana]|uniref:Tetratricopeptide repeat protein 27 n=1 Tax=Periplaneta americana TaxID=6978 RepID=A0ABQ8RXM8_PERAM|nr:hypothetical protein ANN_27097 [Periplaneta americana]
MPAITAGEDHRTNHTIPPFWLDDRPPLLRHGKPWNRTWDTWFRGQTCKLLVVVVVVAVAEAAGGGGGSSEESIPIRDCIPLCVQTQKSQPKDKLADEELMPYLTCLLSNPLVWSLQLSALLQRCRLEGHHSRTVERAMMQTEELVHCIDKEKPNARTRHHYIFCSHLPPRWKVETELANLLISIGVVKSALDIFLQLELWEQVISCYNLLQLRHKAAEVIQQELNKKESVKLWCLLGDATDDPSCYEKAWELSGHKSGRAQRHWAHYYFNKKQYAESIPHLRESLAINSLQVSLWFRLGYAALDQEDWALCATAYQRYCSLDPESFEAWNNLSKAYVKLNQKFRAWMTLQESLKWNYENWRVWDNYMVVSTDVGKFNEVIQAYNRILDLKEKHVDTEVLKILVDSICMSESPGDIKKKAEQLFTRLTQQVRSNTALWQMFVKLMLSHTDSETSETMEKTISYLQKAFWSAIQDSHFERDTKECLDTMKITSQLMDAVEKFKYLGATVKNINDTQEEIKHRINMGNACYYSVEKLLSSSLLSKNLKVRTYKTVILPVVLYGCETWTLILREEHRLRVFENKVLRKIFGAKRDEVTGEWRKLHNTEVHALYSSPDIIRNIKSRRLRWAGHVAHMGESRNAYRVLVGGLEGKRPLGRPRRRWEDNIKMDLREEPMAGLCEGGNEPPDSLKATTLLCCEKCTRPEKAVQMLASAKLCLQTLIARIKKFYPNILSAEESQNTEMSSQLQDLNTKLQEIVSVLQQKKGSL